MAEVLFRRSMDEPTVTIVIAGAAWLVVQVGERETKTVEDVVSVSVVAIDEELVTIIRDAGPPVLVAMARGLHLGAFTGFKFAVVKSCRVGCFKESLVGIYSAWHLSSSFG